MTKAVPHRQPKSRVASGRTQRRSIPQDVIELSRQLEQVKQQARAIGIFTDDRELLECPSCGTTEGGHSCTPNDGLEDPPAVSCPHAEIEREKTLIVRERGGAVWVCPYDTGCSIRCYERFYTHDDMSIAARIELRIEPGHI